MSAVAVIKGQVRQTRENRKRVEPGMPPGEVWGHSASVLTEVGGVLGDTLRVTIFDRDYREQQLSVEPGDDVLWIVELVNDPKYGMQANFKAEASPDAIAA